MILFTEVYQMLVYEVVRFGIEFQCRNKKKTMPVICLVLSRSVGQKKNEMEDSLALRSQISFSSFIFGAVYDIRNYRIHEFQWI